MLQFDQEKMIRLVSELRTSVNRLRHWWVENNPKVLKRILKLGLNTCQNPKTGIGKPEPVGFELQGYWSRRITQEHLNS